MLTRCLKNHLNTLNKINNWIRVGFSIFLKIKNFLRKITTRKIKIIKNE